MNRTIHIKTSLVFIILISFFGYTQNNKPAVESFEKEAVLNKYSTLNSKLSTSKDHYKFGEQSLKWSWSGEASFGTSNFKILTLDESPLPYGDFFPVSPTLQMSIYNETPQNEKITISYEKDGGKEVWFDIPLNFKGWRTIWVPFYEMEGNAPKQGDSIAYDYFKISTTSKSGTLFFDDIIFSQFQDDRHQYPDEIVPFLKKDQDPGADHWMPKISNYNNLKNLKTTPISEAIRRDIEKIEELIGNKLKIPETDKIPISTIIKDFQNLNIKDNRKTIIGPPLVFRREHDFIDKNQQVKMRFNKIRDLGKALRKLALYSENLEDSEKETVESLFLTGVKYFLDQGWQAGSSGGTRHHIGYNIGELTEAFYIKRKLLKKEELLNDVGNSLHWLTNLGLILGNENDFHVNIDYLNTQSYKHLILLFLLDSKEKQAALLTAYSNYISIILAQQKEEWGFKIDGTAWHHNGHYPAYGIGAFHHVPKVIRTLARTHFKIETEGHANFRKAFLATRIYSQKFDWGFGNAGRHPLQGSNIKSLKESFLLMANAGDPTGEYKIDKEVAAAYLRLWGEEDSKNTALFTEKHGIEEEKITGFFTFPYGATAVKKQNDWAAIIKGYSKYVWASEIYVTANRYGRYPANGTIQLLNNDGELGSGFKQHGWDWNRYPGATIVYLPLKELEAKTPLLMFRSNESFAGVTTLGDDGIFGMILNDDKGSNAEPPNEKSGFPEKLKAKKSVFSFGDKLICIGTDISSIDAKNPTQTNLFQTFLQKNQDPMYTPSKKITEFPFKGEVSKNNKGENWIIDPYGNGYHILSNTTINLKKEKQNSYYSKYSVNTGAVKAKGKTPKETEGNFASAWIDHGFAPKNANYQYVIYPFNSKKEIRDFDKKVKKDTSYTILRADNTAHIVKDLERNTTGYVVFEADENLENGILKSVSKPALVMARKNSDNAITLSVVEPDLNFPEGEPGKYKNYSQATTLKITLNGKWETDKNDFITAIETSKTHSNTTITLNCKDGLPQKFELNKQ